MESGAYKDITTQPTHQLTEEQKVELEKKEEEALKYCFLIAQKDPNAVTESEYKLFRLIIMNNQGQPDRVILSEEVKKTYRIAILGARSEFLKTAKEVLLPPEEKKSVPDNKTDTSLHAQSTKKTTILSEKKHHTKTASSPLKAKIDNVDAENRMRDIMLVMEYIHNSVIANGPLAQHSTPHKKPKQLSISVPSTGDAPEPLGSPRSGGVKKPFKDVSPSSTSESKRIPLKDSPIIQKYKKELDLDRVINSIRATTEGSQKFIGAGLTDDDINITEQTIERNQAITTDFEELKKIATDSTLSGVEKLNRFQQKITELSDTFDKLGGTLFAQQQVNLRNFVTDSSDIASKVQQALQSSKPDDSSSSDEHADSDNEKKSSKATLEKEQKDHLTETTFLGKVLTLKNKDGFTLLHCAAYYNHPQLIRDIRDAFIHHKLQKEKVRLFEIKNKQQLTPLNIATMRGHGAVVREIIKTGIPLTRRTLHRRFRPSKETSASALGDSVYHLAIAAGEPDERLVATLMSQQPTKRKNEKLPRDTQQGASLALDSKSTQAGKLTDDSEQLESTRPRRSGSGESHSSGSSGSQLDDHTKVQQSKYLRHQWLAKNTFGKTALHELADQWLEKKDLFIKTLQRFESVKKSIDIEIANVNKKLVNPWASDLPNLRNKQRILIEAKLALLKGADPQIVYDHLVNGYEFSVLTDGAELNLNPQHGKIYLKKDGQKLLYIVRTPYNQVVSGEIPPEYFTDAKMQAQFPGVKPNAKELRPYFPEVLAFLSQAGHTFTDPSQLKATRRFWSFGKSDTIVNLEQHQFAFLRHEIKQPEPTLDISLTTHTVNDNSTEIHQLIRNMDKRGRETLDTIITEAREERNETRIKQLLHKDALGRDPMTLLAHLSANTSKLTADLLERIRLVEELLGPLLSHLQDNQDKLNEVLVAKQAILEGREGQDMESQLKALQTNAILIARRHPWLCFWQSQSKSQQLINEAVNRYEQYKHVARLTPSGSTSD